MPSSRTRRILADLIWLFVLLAFGILLSILISWYVFGQASATASTPRLAPSGVNAQNSVLSYIASHGYRGDSIGHPIQNNGTPDTTTVVLLMPIQSPDFRIGQSLFTDPDTQKQVSMAFTAMSDFYLSATRFGVGLEYGSYLLLYQAAAADVVAVNQGALSIEAFWSTVEEQAAVLDAVTWAPAYDKNFSSKDFQASRKLTRILPPNAEPPARINGSGQIIAQPSTAYLPSGQALTLVGTAISSTGILAANEPAEFSLIPEGADPQQFSATTTDANGSARAQFTPPAGLGDVILLSVSSRQVGTSALAPVMLGPAPAESDAASVITGSLALHGYNVLSVSHDIAEQEASAVAEMVAPRFDRSARGQILTTAGTLFTVYPDIRTAKPILLYRYGGNSYELLFEIERADWQSWLAGTSSEADFWELIDLSQIIDAQSGRLISERDFFDKDFAAEPERTDIITPRQIAGSLTIETWGEQLNPGLIRIPVGGFAVGFTVEELTAGSGFAIYNVVDPITPIYDSAQDPAGDILRALQLANGQYLLSITTGSAPATVRLSYTEHLLDSSSTAP